MASLRRSLTTLFHSLPNWDFGFWENYSSTPGVPIPPSLSSHKVSLPCRVCFWGSVLDCIAKVLAPSRDTGLGSQWGRTVPEPDLK